jgi:transcriptional regulator with XRE-family HTH domain
MSKTRARATPFDKIVGERIKDVRLSRGWSQKTLADMLGLTFQQIQKYERGINRISASRLYLVARAVGVSVDELCQKPSPKASRSDISGVPQTRLTLELYRHALALPPERRRILLQMAKAASEA